jgi:hypothetical protein
MIRAIVIVLAAAFAASGSAQPPVAPAPRPAVGEVSLLVVEAIPEKDGEFSTAYRLVRVRFKQGVMQPPETIWEGESSSFFLLEARLYHNRYVVSTGGGVIDVVAKKVINPDPCGGCYVRGARVVYRIDEKDRERGIFAFNLVTHKVEKLSNLGDPDYDWSRLSHDRISPDGRRVVKGYEELSVYEPGQKPRPLGTGFSATGTGPSPTADFWPILWLDNARILTQVRNGELVIVTLDGTRSPVVKVPATESRDESLPSLDREPDGRVSYHCGRDRYIIDVDAKKWQRLEWRGLGHGFEINLLPDDDAREIRYRGTPIGRAWVAGPTTEGYLVVEDEEGPRIWSASTREWSVLKATGASLVGWMK